MDTSRSLFQLLRDSTLAADLAAGRVVTAGWLQSGDWRSARALAAQHSLVVIDAEHGAIDLGNVALCIEVMAGNGCLALVRVPLDDDGRKSFARRCLDAGAIGILFPNIQSAEAAATAVANCYYPSAKGISGTRGFGFGGCNVDGQQFAEYASFANEKIIIGVQLEHTSAFQPGTLEAILATPGVRFTQDGPFDHSGSHLVPGKTDDPRVVEELSRYRQACNAAGIPAGKHVVLPTTENIRQAVEDGYSFIALGTDMRHIQQGCRDALATVAAGLGEK
eukprot:m.23416 g.23416  ORF g.23416 m.23416 type:complete len:278 (-) comp4119_c0_seq1:155-988(-)